MKQTFHPIAFLLLFLLLSSDRPLIGQNPYALNYDTKDGLPSSEVYYIHIDTMGLVWMTTDRGVCTYNGYEFKSYTTKDGLSNNTNFKIVEDLKNRYWFLAYDGGLSYFENGRFQPHPLNDSLKDTEKGYWMKQLLFDQSNTPHFNFAVPHITDKYFGIDQKEQNIFFKETSKQSFFLALNHKSIEVIAFETGHFVRYNDSIYLESFSISEKELYFFESEKIYHVKDGLLEEIHTPNQTHVIFMYVDKEHTIWIGTQEGLLQYEGGDFTKTPRHFFKEFHTTCFRQDLEGSYWLSTLSNGVFYVPSFQFLTATKGKEPTSGNVMSLGASNKHLAFGFSDGTIGLLDEHDEVEYIKTKSLRGISIKKIYTKQGKWHASYGIWGDDQSRINYLPTVNRTNERNWGDIVYPIRAGEFFAASFPSYNIRDSKGNIIWRDSFNLGATITCVEMEEDNIWIGTLKGIFFIENYDYNGVKRVFQEFPLLQTRISNIQFQKNNLWISTVGNGLFCKTADSLYHWTTTDGLNSDLINNIFFEEDSILWIATNKGLNRIDLALDDNKVLMKAMKNYTTADGLKTNFINDVMKWKDKLWLATNKGLNYFDPEKLKESTFPPQVLIDLVEIGGENFSGKENIELQYNQNDIRFGFTGIAYRKPEDRPFYRYRLKQTDEEQTWQYTDNRNIQFTNLEPGQYTFEVTARNKYNYWRPQLSTYSFSIQPHFSETWWFRILTLVTIIGGISFVFYRRSQTIQKRETQKRELQLAKFKTKEAELMVLRNQMNPHFVFNSLNSIQHFIFNQDIRQANYFLSKFSRLMRDSLQFSKLEYISIKEEVDFLRSYLELEKMRFGNKFDFKFKIDEAIPVRLYKVPPLLIQPILENAIKHAFKDIDYQGMLKIEIQKQSEKVVKIIINDNGCGIAENALTKKNMESDHQSMGLAIVQDRIDLLNTNQFELPASFCIYNLKKVDSTLMGTRAELVVPVGI